MHGLTPHFFLALINILLSGCTTVQLSFHLLKDILVSSNFWQLWINFLWTHACRFLCRHRFSNPLGKYQGVWLLDCMVWVRVFTLVRNCQTIFRSGCTILRSYKQWKKENSAFGVVNVLKFGHSNRYGGISLHIVLISWWHLPTFKCLGLEWHSLLLLHSPLVRTRHSPEPDSRSEKHKRVPGCWGRTKVSATGLKRLGMAFLAAVSQLYLLPWIQVYSGVQVGLEKQTHFCDWERTGTWSPETSLESQELDMLNHQEHLADLGHTSEGATRVSPSSSLFRSESTQPSRKCRASEPSHASAQLFVSSAQGGNST